MPERLSLAAAATASSSVMETHKQPRSFGQESWNSVPSGQHAFQQTILELASELVGAPQLDDSINRALQRIGQHCGVDRAYVFMLRADNVTIDNTHEWCASGITAQKHNLQKIVVADELPWFWGHMTERRICHVPRVSELSAAASADRAHFERQNIKSLIVVPMECNDRFVGFIGFDAVRALRDWSEDVVRLLKLSADMVGRAVVRCRTEDALAQREQELSRMYDSVPLPMLVVDSDLRVRRANQTARDAWGAGSNMVGARPGTVLRCVHSLDNPKGCGYGPDCARCGIRLQVLDTLRNGRTINWADHWIEVGQDDSGPLIRECTVSTVPVLLYGREHVLVTLHDVTEWRAAERRLRQREVELAHACRLHTLGEMAAGLTHEITQPLTAIENYASGLQTRLHLETANLEDVGEGVERIRREAERAVDIVRHARSYVHPGQLELVRADVNRVIHDAIQLVAYDSRRIGAEICQQLEQELPDISVDRVQIEQVIVNLLRNALDAVSGLPAARRRVEIRASRMSDAAILISVADDGIGIPATDEPQLFTAFFTSKSEGLGMGLAVCRSIIENHHGHIGFRRKSPHGSIFEMRLPIKRDDE